MITLPYGLYMAEQEDFLNTRKSAIQKIIKKVKNYPGESLPNLVFYTICEDCGIHPGSLTKAEMDHINREIKA